MTLDWIITLSAMAGGFVLLALSIWQTNRPPRDTPRARWAPWRFMMLVAAAVIMLAALHLLTLSGFKPPASGGRFM